jgi:hypothetical protein
LEPAQQTIWLLAEAEQACEAMQGYLKVEASKVKRGNITKLSQSFSQLVNSSGINALC